MSGRLLAAAILLSAAASIGLGRVHPFGDPREERPKGRATLLEGSSVPAPARAVLLSKCADCHSAETRWPVYSRLAPGSWLIERDIIEGRKHMDLSRWAELPVERQEVLEAEIVQQAKAGKMPPAQYRLLHWGAGLSPQDVAALAALRKSAGAMDTRGGGAGDAVTGDAGRGRLVFERRCTGCHAMDSDREGPRLAKVYGRRAGSVAGFSYSESLRRSGLSWDEATLERWFEDPDALVPGNNMSIAVPKAADRRDLIAYLKQ